MPDICGGQALADLVGIPSEQNDAFMSSFKKAVDETARQYSARRRRSRARDVKPHFARLRQALEALSESGSGSTAGAYLSAVMASEKLCFEEWLDNSIRHVDRAEYHATKHAQTRLPRTRGPSIHPLLEEFFVRVLVQIRRYGGDLSKLTLYRAQEVDEAEAKGTFINILEAIRPSMPEGLMPSSPYSSALVEAFKKAKALATKY